MNETSQTLYQPQNPYPYYQQMRERQPVFYDQEQQIWQVFRYADVERVFTDYHTFSSQTACCPITTQFHSFYRMDPPDLQRYRSLVSSPFTPLAVERLTDRITDLTAALLDRVALAGQMDVIDDLAFPLPLQVMADLLGLPPQDEDRYTALAKDILRELGEEQPALRAYLLDLLTERRNTLRPGLITSLLEARPDGQPLHQEEVLGICGQLFLGANVEITPLLSNVVQSLLEHPELTEELSTKPELIPGAIEEMLRFYPPVPSGGPRRATVDVELGGQRIREGQRVIALIASANRDEEVFTRPDQFDIRRQPNPHLSFVTGPHICLGIHLSRLIARIALAALLEGFEHLQIAPGERLVPAGCLGASTSLSSLVCAPRPCHGSGRDH